MIISAPAKDEVDATVVLGVNFEEAYDPERHAVISMASCTTGCLAPVAHVLHESLGIRHGAMTTIHAYTGDQSLVDLPHKDLRRARAAALNIVPTSTGAAKAIGLVIPELAGRLQGFAARVPGADRLARRPDGRGRAPDDGRGGQRALRRGRRPPAPLASILGYSDEPLVSTDVIKSPFSSLFDPELTLVVGGTQVKMVAWYDNEWGYSVTRSKTTLALDGRPRRRRSPR